MFRKLIRLELLTYFFSRRSRRTLHRTNLRRSNPLRLERLENRAMMAADLLNIDELSYERDEFLVRFQSPEAAANFANHPSGGLTLGDRLTEDGWYEIEVSSDVNLEQALLAFQGRTDIVATTPNFRVSISAAPNDTSYASLWGLENGGASGGVIDADIDAEQAWQYGTSSNVVVAVIDTGVDYNHPDLASNIWSNANEVAGDGIDNDKNGYVDDIRGWNFVSNNNNPMDDNNHGTHVAGTIGAVGNNQRGVVGVAWDVDIMPLKFLSATGSGVLSHAVSAIDYANRNGAKVINASWGGGGFSSALQSAIQRFQNAGGIFVAAAGNESSNNASTAAYPANYPGVISVAASTRTDALASFSNFGTNVEIAAPGASILSTVRGGGYSSFNGTSMAAPHVAGAFALLWGHAPSKTSTELIDLVMANTDNVLRDRTTFGRLNVGKAAQALHDGGSPVDIIGPTVNSAAWVRSANNLSAVDLTFSEAIIGSTLASSVALTGPAGTLPVTSVVALDGTNTHWRVSFDQQSAVGTYSITIVPNVTDAAGNAMDQNRNGTAGESADTFTSQTAIETTRSYTRGGPISLLDATRTRTSTTRISLDIADAISIQDIDVRVNIAHTYISDIRVRLIGPDGTVVTLVNRRGGAADDLRVLFDDQASSPISQAPTNFAGTYRPEAPLSAFQGKSATGRWFLEVTDYAYLDAGRLESFSLIITPSVAAAQSQSQSASAGPAGRIASTTIAPESVPDLASSNQPTASPVQAPVIVQPITNSGIRSRAPSRSSEYETLVDAIFRLWQ